MGGVLKVILEKTKTRADPYQGGIYRNLLYINSLYSYLLYLDLLTAMQLVVINHNGSPVVSGQWSVVSGQWSVVSGQWSVVSGQLSV